jgi:choline-glycine betaine transporter
MSPVTVISYMLSRYTHFSIGKMEEEVSFSLISFLCLMRDLLFGAALLALSAPMAAK